MAAGSRRSVTRPGRGASGGSSYRGEAGMARVEQEIQKQKDAAEARKNQRNEPFRFFVPVGETRQIIVADDKPDFFRYEHALKGPTGHFNKFTGCVKENDNCPVCESAGKESYYAMYLTVIDLTPFKTKTGEKVEFSRKLMVVKPAQQKKLIRLYKKEGTLRGMILDMTRDGEMSPAIGNDIEFVDFADEKELKGYTRSWKDRDGKKHTEDCAEPYDYDELYPDQTADELRDIVGGKPTPGSRAADREELERPTRGRARRASDEDAEDFDEEDKDDVPWEGEDGDGEEDKPRRGRRAAKDEEEEEAPRGRRARREEPDADEEEAPRSRRGRRAEPDADEEEEAPPARGRRARREEPEEEEPPRRSRRARPEPEEEPEADAGDSDPDGDEEDEQPARSPRRVQPRRAAARGRAEADEEPRRARRSR